ncbi:hypothetical protein ACFPIJ_16610 [Dactylosporangium cerinum]|uniref:Uncharacterized protein n=1 Tax=Dactylosporangium cerinum TaxID=1434730 RepID=A0ABV9VTW7_9ACTN
MSNSFDPDHTDDRNPSRSRAARSATSDRDARRRPGGRNGRRPGDRGETDARASDLDDRRGVDRETVVDHEPFDDQPAPDTRDARSTASYRDDTDARASDLDDRRGIDRETVIAREEERYGGVKIGAAFFGWLTAIGMAVLLTALISAAGTAISLATGTDLGNAAAQATQGSKTIGAIGALALLIITFVAYYCGGHVAARMARFNGVRQGVAVWLWAVVIAVVVAILGLVAGDQYDVLAKLNSLPRVPVNEGTVTAAGVIALLAVAVASLIGAVLGGRAGMRFHRNVDRAGLGL